jgi:cellobiose phosphorylase
MGDLDTARAIFRGMLPAVRSAEDPELYAAEPYVMPGNIDGPDSPFAGRAGWTWYTGSAAWMVRIAENL